MRETLLWTLKKDGDTIRAIMRAVDEGFELRLECGSMQVFSQMCHARADLQLLATREYTHLLARGWEAVPLREELTRGDHILPGDTANEIDSLKREDESE